MIVMICVLSGCSRKKPETSSDKYARHHRLGVKTYKAGKYHEALMYFEKAVRIEPEKADLYLTIATIYEDCLDPPNLEEMLEAKRKAIEYYEMFLEKSGDSTAKKRAGEWLDNCKMERMALEAGIPPEDLRTEDVIEREKAIEKLQKSLGEIERQYTDRLDKIYDLESKVSELTEVNRELMAKTGREVTKSKPISPLSWILLGILGIIVITFGYSLRRAPVKVAEEKAPKPVVKNLIPEEKIAGSYVWVESVHNRGMMMINREESGFFVQTRAINTSATSSGYGKYEDNVLKAMLTDDKGEGALMSFEFFENGRNFIASWEDELGHGSAVGLRNEFDEMVRPDTREKKLDE